MKRLKSIILYGVIVLLCVAAFGGYVIKKLSDESDKPVIAVTTTTESDPATKKAVLITDGNNIAGRTDEENQAHIKTVMARETEVLDPNPIVGIGQGTDYAQVTADAIANAGGLTDIIKEGDVVLIKPNLCVQNEDVDSPMITDYRVVQQAIDSAYACGASRVIVAEGNFSSNAFENEENKYVDLVGAELFNFNDCTEEDCYELQPQNSLTGKALFIPKIYMDADVVITVAKLKTHFLTGVSLGLKNCIGVPSYQIYGGAGEKAGLHALSIFKVVVDINEIRKPDFTIIDGIIGGEGYGPTMNTPIASNVIIAGKDIVAVDTVGITFMGYDINRVNHVKASIEAKIGIGDLNAISIVGADLDAIKMKFKTSR